MSTSTCDNCAVTWGRWNNAKRIVLCPLHRATPNLLAALKGLLKVAPHPTRATSMAYQEAHYNASAAIAEAEGKTA